MTRDTDEYLRLDDRVRIARQHEADLLISIHADTISVKGIRGATVYTVSDKASDPEAQALADRENLSDQFAGMVIKDDNKEVTDILIDLIRRETHNFSMSFAHTLVGQLSTSVGLINNPQRSAGFKVLKARTYRPFWSSSVISPMPRTKRNCSMPMARQGRSKHHQRRRIVASAQTEREPEADMPGGACNQKRRCATTTPGAFISALRSRNDHCRILSTWWRHGFSIAVRDRFESLRERRLRFRKFPNQGLERV